MRRFLFLILCVWGVLFPRGAAAGGTDPKTSEETDASGRTMSKIVREAKRGFPSEFLDTEIVAVMNAARSLKETDPGLARRLEGVAARMAGSRSE